MEAKTMEKVEIDGVDANLEQRLAVARKKIKALQPIQSVELTLNRDTYHAEKFKSYSVEISSRYERFADENRKAEESFGKYAAGSRMVTGDRGYGFLSALPLIGKWASRKMNEKAGSALPRMITKATDEVGRLEQYVTKWQGDYSSAGEHIKDLDSMQSQAADNVEQLKDALDSYAQVGMELKSRYDSLPQREKISKAGVALKHEFSDLADEVLKVKRQLTAYEGTMDNCEMGKNLLAHYREELAERIDTYSSAIGETSSQLEMTAKIDTNLTASKKAFDGLSSAMESYDSVAFLVNEFMVANSALTKSMARIAQQERIPIFADSYMRQVHSTQLDTRNIINSIRSRTSQKASKIMYGDVGQPAKQAYTSETQELQLLPVFNKPQK